MTRLVTLAFFLAIAATSQGAELLGRVVGVTDGDTLTLLDANSEQHKVRLAGIDCRERGQPFGSVAKRALGDLVAGQPVRVGSTSGIAGGVWAAWCMFGGALTA